MSEAAAWFAGLERFARTRPLGFLLVAILAISVPVMLVPGIDIAISRLFYVPGVGFAAGKAPGPVALRSIGQWVTGLLAVFVLVSLIASAFGRFRYLLGVRAACFLALSLLLGPALLVNGIMKELWGRVRPRDIVEFGGTLDFTPAWQVYGHCTSNCSFVSGEASSSICILAFVLVMAKEWRARAATWLFGYAFVMSMNRLAFGGHFMSDILLSWCVTLIVVIACYRLCYWTEYQPMRAGSLRLMRGIPGAIRQRIATVQARKPIEVGATA
jgi:lipid A 4'-phosphatase